MSSDVHAYRASDAEVGPGTPIFDDVLRWLATRGPSQPGAHTQPVEPTPCTPEFWFGPPVHSRRHSGTTTVIPAVVDEHERKAS